MEYVNNKKLIENCLKHIELELYSKNPSYFRIAVEAHQMFYKAMVEAVKGGSNFLIEKKGRSKGLVIRNGNHEIKLESMKIPACQHAWRFLEKEIKSSDNLDENDFYRGKENKNPFLPSFYELLAMIQSDSIMNIFGSEAILLNDKDIVKLEWLHERIRNEYEHFIPKEYGISIHDLIFSSHLCLQLCEALLINKFNLFVFGIKDSFKRKLRNIIDVLNGRIN